MTPSRVVLAEYFTGQDVTLLFIVRADFEKPEVIEIKMSLSRLREFAKANFGTINGSSKADELDLVEWQNLFSPFIQPVLNWTEEGDLIWFVPHDVLHYLPLHALRIDEGQEEERYLIDRNPVCYTPSASVMKYCQAKKRSGHSQKALVLGDPGNNLSHARAEALEIASLFQTAPLVGEQATKSQLKQMLDKERDGLQVLHFSCHSYFDQNQALKSGIILAPEPEQESSLYTNSTSSNGILTAEEIFKLQLQTDLVTVSACESGVNEHHPGDELIGLTRALIYAGTPSVLVSLWAVKDISTRLLMQHFYRQLQKTPPENGGRSVTKAQALQAAQQFVKNLTLKMLLELDGNAQSNISPDMLTIKPFEHPYYWAPFVLIGDWR